MRLKWFVRLKKYFFYYSMAAIVVISLIISCLQMNIEHIFIYSDMEDRVKRILERYSDSEKPIQKRITDKDTRRKIYYSHYIDRPWGIPQNYDLCLNSGALGEELCVNSIINLFNGFERDGLKNG